MIRKSFTLTNSCNEFIRGDLRFRESTKNSPAIIICHGFTGFKDWGFLPVLSETLADAGYVTLTFNFSRNGIGTDFDKITEFDKFASNTYSHELQDLDCILDAINTGKIGKGLIDRNKIGLFGHSRGGGLVLLRAARDDTIQTVVTWSAISTVQRFTVAQINDWQATGHLEIENKQSRQKLGLALSLLKDIQENAATLDILQAAARLTIPVLIIHGDADDSVPAEEANQIYTRIKSADKQLFIIEGANHTFGVNHPLRTRSAHLETALDLTESWFDKYLNL